MLLEALVDLFKLFLSLGLVFLEVVLVLEVAPKLQLRSVRGKELVGHLNALAEVWLLVHLLQLVRVGVHQELVGVHVLRHADAR